MDLSEKANRIPLELLAPAGGPDQLRAAIDFGADAVYLATERFGMRARAANFALDGLASAVEYAHGRGVKIHVACNILMGQDDIADLPPYFEALERAGADACIIGDLGAATLLRRHAPSVELHVSTQASVANALSAKVWHDLGATRIVCAREMSLEDIRRLRAEIPADLQIEAFAHGAMCMAVSGRCLISSYLTGRSGNRGVCTQPCRWHYTLEEEKRPGEHFPIEEDAHGSYIMNAKDMNMLAHLRELADAGVDSIKIEGRNKKAFYVASVVNAYRRVLDGEDPKDVMSELYDVSHRPYGTGFYFGEAEQAPAYDGYEQETMHVADVVGCMGVDDVSGGTVAHDGDTAPTGGATGKMAGEQADESAGETSYWLYARCRNRFDEGETLEALRPRKAPVELVVKDLTWLPDQEDGSPEPTPQPVATANRACAIYRFRAARPVEEGAFLRVRRHRRSARHE